MRHVTVLFLVAVGCVHLWMYVDYPINPFTHATGGWEEWWDQNQYLKSARALAAGNLEASNHWYPLGYALLGAPFAALGARDPFLVPNLVGVLVFAGAYLAFFRPLIGAPATLVAFGAAMLLPVTCSSIDMNIAATGTVLHGMTNSSQMMWRTSYGVSQVIRRQAGSVEAALPVRRHETSADRAHQQRDGYDDERGASRGGTDLRHRSCRDQSHIEIGRAQGQHHDPSMGRVATAAAASAPSRASFHAVSGSCSRLLHEAGIDRARRLPLRGQDAVGAPFVRAVMSAAPGCCDNRPATLGSRARSLRSL